MLAMSAVAAHVLALLPCGALALVAPPPLSRAPRVPLRSPPASLVVSDLRTSTSTPSAAKDGSPSSWLDLWIPVCFTAAIPEDGLLPATIFERPLVLFRDQDAVHCLADQCPHRLAPLSDGRLTTDETGARRVECSYHGWHFSGCGRCTKLPQLEAGKPILPLYDAARHPVTESQGIVYVWLGDRDKAASTAVPRVPELDDESWMYEQDYMRDLPYDYTTLVENIIDPSHVPVSHHGTTQGNRALAQPLTITHGVPNGTWPLGFAGETEVPLHGSNRLGFTQQKAVQRVAFTAPSLLTYSFSVAAGDACAIFYPIPVARGRSRILVRRARNFATSRRMGRAALVAKHLENNVVFDQDMAFLRGQEARLQARRPDGWGGAWRSRPDSTEGSGGGYVMPADADRFVISFRKQLDSVAASLPWRSAPSAAVAFAPPMPRRTLLDRYEQHTKGCAVCSAALDLTKRCLTLSSLTAHASVMATLVALAVPGVPSKSFRVLCAVGAAAYSTALLSAYIVGPIIGAVPNSLAAAPLVAAALSLVAFALDPAGGLARGCAFALPALTACCAFWAVRALERLRDRFIFTEEAKALQDS